MRLEHWLGGRGRWLTGPSTWANVMVALLAALHAGFTLALPPGSLSAFLLVVVVVGGVWVSLAEWLATRWLPTYRALCTRQVATLQDNLVAALKEVRPFPEVVAKLTLAVWGLAVLSLAVAARVLFDAPWSACRHLVFMGVIFAPMAAVLAGLLVSQRAQVVAERLAGELSVKEALAALGGNQVGVRPRLVAFTLAMVALPSVMLADVGRTMGDAVLERLVAAPAAERALLVAEHQHALLLRSSALGLLVLAMALVAAWAGARVIGTPMQRLAGEARRIAEGELRPARVFAADGEVWHVTRVFADMQDRLSALIRQLQGAGGRISEAASTLHGISHKHTRGAADQAAALNETTATTEELARSARQIAASAATVMEIARQTMEATGSGRAMAEAFHLAVERMKQDNRSIAEAVERLTGRVQQIGHIVEFINGVADRTDLLALSAALEGTRAGEVGRGFSLVSAEMRSLAENVLVSTREIEELIAEIREATRSTAEATSRGSSISERGTALAGEVALALEEVSFLANETSSAVRTISLATQQQETGTDQLAEAMADILTITQEGLVTTQQLGTANDRLQALSTALRAHVDRFRIVA